MAHCALLTCEMVVMMRMMLIMGMLVVNMVMTMVMLMMRMDNFGALCSAHLRDGGDDEDDADYGDVGG